MSRELLFSVTKKDFTRTTFTSGGPGGQHANKVATGVRLKHNPSGAVGESKTHKSQIQNQKAALQRLMATTQWRIWSNEMLYIATKGESIAQTVDKAMRPQNLRVEVKDENGRWIEDDAFGGA